MRYRYRRRQAFTLVELMVAMALIIFIMAILSEAFVVGMKTFRDLKAVGDMDQNLRTITVKLRDDLANDHFEGRRRLSDPTFWAQGIPREGFFNAVQMKQVANVPVGGITVPGYYDEGPDGDGNHSFVATDHRLHFTVKRRGNQKDRYFSTSIPAGSPLLLNTNFDSELGAGDGRMQDPAGTTYNSQWAEVGYFLLPTTDGAGGPGPIGTPLFALYRVELAITPDNSKINWASNPPIAGVPIPGTSLANYAGLSCNVDTTSPAGNLYFNNPSDLTTTIPINRRAFDPMNIQRQGQAPFTAQNANLLPATLLMTDVISFHVQFLLAWDKPVPQGTGEVLVQENKVYGTFRDFTGFDTGSTPPDFSGLAPPAPGDFPLVRPTDTNPPRIVAIKIAIRVWDAKTQQARQITVVQDM